MNDPLEQFLNPYIPEVRALALRTRALVLEAVPDAIEQIDSPSKLIAYSFGPRMADVVCTIMPLKSAVNLGIYRGAELLDPAQLLHGTGKLHRHVRINTPDDLENAALRHLLEAAVAAKNSSVNHITSW